MFSRKTRKRENWWFQSQKRSSNPIQSESKYDATSVSIKIQRSTFNSINFQLGISPKPNQIGVKTRVSMNSYCSVEKDRRFGTRIDHPATWVFFFISKIKKNSLNWTVMFRQKTRKRYPNNEMLLFFVNEILNIIWILTLHFWNAINGRYRNRKTIIFFPRNRQRKMWYCTDRTIYISRKWNKNETVRDYLRMPHLEKYWKLK